MQYEINCSCGKVLTGEATHDNYAVWCDCGTKHLARASGFESTPRQHQTHTQQAFASPKKSVLPIQDDHYSRNKIRSDISAAAIGLIVVSSITVVLSLLGLAGDVLILTSGMVDNLQRPAMMDKQDQITIRMIWGIIMLCANVFVLFGAVSMKNLGNYHLAKSAATVAVIPCIGPCFVLGIPFGIMAFSVLGRMGVREAFDR